MLTMAMATTAMAAEYNIDGPEDPLFASPTSVDQVTVVGGGVTEQSNIDRSKNAAVVPPPFGSPESYQTGSGAVLIPQTQTQTSGSATTPIGGGTAYYPPAESVTPPASDVTTSSTSSTPFTLPDGLYYSDGSIGRLKIPSIGVNVKVYETESLESLAKGGRTLQIHLLLGWQRGDRWPQQRGDQSLRQNPHLENRGPDHIHHPTGYQDV